MPLEPSFLIVPFLYDKERPFNCVQISKIDYFIELNFRKHYTRIQGMKKPVTIAYEVELSAKNVQKYEALLRFYRTARLVDRVIWLVQSQAIRDTILRAKSCIKDDSTNYHLFVDLHDFIKNGWDAAVANDRSERLFTLRENYQELCGDLYGDLIGKFKGHSRVTVHLANQKVLGKPRP